MRSARAIATLAIAAACLVATNALVRTPHATVSADDVAARAHRLHFSTYVIDTHDDTTQRFLSKSGFDLSKRYTDGSIDIPRMKEGGMNGIFFSIWIDGKTMGPQAIQQALDQIDLVRTNVAKFPKDIVLARTAEDVRRAHAQNKIGALMGVEGGHMIGNDIHIVNIFADLGVRYMTLSHFYNTEWSDSSTDKPAHNGLTDFGKEVVREMNRQGIMVDISHVSDKTFYDALEVSKAPLIASHSSCRAICDHVRDMSDDMIKALAAKGGVIQINYEKSFIDQAYKDAYAKATGGVVANIDNLKKKCGDDGECFEKEMKRIEEQLIAEGKLPRVTWEKVVEHIDHAVKLVGADHVGLGSDFDGANMPEGLEDASKLPIITEALLRKGYSDSDVRKILGENTLRVMEAAEKVSAEMKAQNP
ncbi:MAG TPA: dipeptidase [Candidatus Sulfotelmatobacter sp.]|nr:dipeptidase [Candidatus Sulfotelmatobacter sp.]